MTPREAAKNAYAIVVSSVFVAIVLSMLRMPGWLGLIVTPLCVVCASIQTEVENQDRRRKNRSG